MSQWNFVLHASHYLLSIKKLYSYELLFRGNEELSMAGTEGNKATFILLSTTFLTEWIEKISGFKPCFINFPEKLLLKGIPTVFPRKLWSMVSNCSDGSVFVL